MKNKIDFSKIPESDIVIKYCIQRYKKGLGTTMFVIGLPGSGKSSASQRLGELISKEIHGKKRFGVNNLVDSLMGLIKFVKNVKQPGEILVVEEVSVLFPSRRAMAKENVAIGKVMDTIRKKQVILIANAPIFPSMDSHLRALGDILIETLRINKREKIVISKALRLQTNPRSGKTYLHRFERNGKDVHKIYTRMPNMETWNKYEETKDKFMENLYAVLEHEAGKKKLKLDKEMGLIKPLKPLTIKELQVYELVKVKKMTYQQAGIKMGVTFQRIGVIMKQIEKKSEIPRGIKHISDEKTTTATKSKLVIGQT